MKYLLFLILLNSGLFLFTIANKNIHVQSSFSLAAGTDSANWLTDLSDAKAKVKAEKKPILLYFTGSDWCGWCIKLKKEVFSKPAFVNYAKESLILMSIDFPNRKFQSKSLEEQNNKLMNFYRVEGFPTIILLDPNGKVVGKTGYRDGGAEAYVAHLKALLSEKF